MTAREALKEAVRDLITESALRGVVGIQHAVDKGRAALRLAAQEEVAGFAAILRVENDGKET